ncbi:Uncharacterised protein [Yersinia enterocolitica]|uniref:Uncharacterized protein n=1 Tax=Yersinia enterocolitica TaxID=630 RepID=A0A9P1V1E5_YEREN|nr:hypothetical protein FORC066_3919 [Yersinia enterocolitica]CNF78366.1 Uncharacterised protein [Yersinia enterocolitica]CNG63993.1 Uncharacterised protein [Yersinia enterocolitica]CQH15961.1 Uncharacterised protein [Yersinia enterocolitica]CQQ36309.1 Uncharacterised protein [Yersinia enterocolitica]
MLLRQGRQLFDRPKLFGVAARQQTNNKSVGNRFEQHLCCPKGEPKGQGSLIPMSLHK